MNIAFILPEVRSSLGCDTAESKCHFYAVILSEYSDIH